MSRPHHCEIATIQRQDTGHALPLSDGNDRSIHEIQLAIGILVK
jgi:hypothetical protein